MEVVNVRPREQRLNLVVLGHVSDGASYLLPHANNRLVPTAVADSGDINIIVRFLKYNIDVELRVETDTAKKFGCFAYLSLVVADRVE